VEVHTLIQKEKRGVASLGRGEKNRGKKRARLLKNNGVYRRHPKGGHFSRGREEAGFGLSTRLPRKELEIARKQAHT